MNFENKQTKNINKKYLCYLSTTLFQYSGNNSSSL